MNQYQAIFAIAAERAALEGRTMNHATDGICHNANHGTFNHECSKPATWLGTKANGWQSGFCDHCKAHGDERHAFVTWVRKVEG